MSRIIVERNFDSPPSEADLNAAAIRERPCLAAYGVTWRRSLFSTDRMRMICEYDGPDAESVRRVQREAGNLFDRAWPGEVIE